MSARTSPRLLDITLTPADALAWEMLPRPWRGVRLVGLYVWLGSVGLVLAMLPEELVGHQAELRFWIIGLVLIGIAYAISVLLTNVAARLRARRRLAAGARQRVEVWPDHLILVGTAGRQRIDDAETGAPVLTATHLFVPFADDVIILPATAFPRRADMEALVARLDAAGKA